MAVAPQPSSSVLRDLRMRLHLTQSEVARRAGVSQQAVGAWEAGTARPDHSRRNRLAAILEVDEDDLEVLLAAPTQSRGEHSARLEARVADLERTNRELTDRLSVIQELLRLERQKVEILIDGAPTADLRRIARIADDQLVQIQVPDSVPND